MVNRSSDNLAEASESFEYPEFVYINLPLEFAAIAATIPHKYAKIPQDISEEPAGELSIQIKNNEKYKKLVLSNEEVLERVSSLIGDANYHVARQILETAQRMQKDVARNDFIQFILLTCDHADPAGIMKGMVEDKLKELLNIQIENPETATEITGVLYEDAFIPLEEIDEFKSQLETSLAALYDHGPKKGDYLYRAVNEKEWAEIQKNQAFFIRSRTNFERQEEFNRSDSQVKMYAQEAGYAGQIIRIKVEGPYYCYSGGPGVLRIEPTIPHFAQIEVWQDDQWVKLA